MQTVKRCGRCWMFVPDKEQTVYEGDITGVGDCLNYRNRTTGLAPPQATKEVCYIPIEKDPPEFKPAKLVD
jgi:hypothetical protein